MMTFAEFLSGVNAVPMDVDAERSRFNRIADPDKDPDKYARLKKFADQFGGVPAFLAKARRDPSLYSRAWSAAYGQSQGADEA